MRFCGFSVWVGVLVLGLVAGSASAAMFMDMADFNAYSLGAIQGQFGWGNQAGGGGALIVDVSGDKVLELNGEANNGAYGRYFGPGNGDSGNIIANGTPAYRSFILNVKTLPSAAGGAGFIAFGIGGPPLPQCGKGYLYVKPVGGQYQIGVSNGDAGPATATYSAMLLDVNTEYVIMDKFLADAGTLAITEMLWIDPANESSPSITATDVGTSYPMPPGGINRIHIIQNNFFWAGQKSGVEQIDNLKVATTWAEAFQLVPEPGVLSLLALAGLACLRRGR